MARREEAGEEKSGDKKFATGRIQMGVLTAKRNIRQIRDQNLCAICRGLNTPTIVMGQKYRNSGVTTNPTINFIHE